MVPVPLPSSVLEGMRLRPSSAIVYTSLLEAMIIQVANFSLLKKQLIKLSKEATFVALDLSVFFQL